MRLPSLTFLAASALVFSFLVLTIAPAGAAELQPRSYAYLLSHASLVAVGKVESVTLGFMSEGRKATLDVYGLIKGKLRKKEIQITWNDVEFDESAYKNGATVVVFVNMMKDSTYAQVSPGISAWPVERIDFRGKSVRAIEYAYPMDLVTDVPQSALRETEVLEKSMNFQVTKRKIWILADNLLPPVKPLVLPKPAKPKPSMAKGKPKPKVKAKIKRKTTGG